jgi:hypothetical protein
LLALEQMLVQAPDKLKHNSENIELEQAQIQLDEHFQSQLLGLVQAKVHFLD